MNGTQHRIMGALVGGGFYMDSARIFESQPTLGGLVVAVGAGVVMASLPDLIEPADHPNHRAFFHSVVFNGALAVCLSNIWFSERPPSEKTLLMILGLAWLSHSCLDALTPKSLPFI